MKEFNPILIAGRFKILLGYLEDRNAEGAEQSVADLVHDLELGLASVADQTSPSGRNFRPDYATTVARLTALRAVEEALRTNGAVYAAGLMRKTLADDLNEKPPEPIARRKVTET